MDPEDGMAKSPGDEMVRPKTVPFKRRKELLAFALELAETVMARTETHEHCLLNGMVQSLLERY